MRLGRLGFALVLLLLLVAPRPAAGWQECVAALAEEARDDENLEFDVRTFWMNRLLLVDQIEKVFPNPEDARKVLFSIGVLSVQNRRIADAVDQLEGHIRTKLSIAPGSTVVAVGTKGFQNVRDSEYEQGKVAALQRDGTMEKVDARLARPNRRLVAFLLGEDDGSDKPKLYTHLTQYPQQFLPRTVQYSVRRMLVVLALSKAFAPHEEVLSYFEKYFMFTYRVLAIFDDLARRVLAEHEKTGESIEALWSRLEVATDEKNEVRP